MAKRTQQDVSSNKRTRAGEHAEIIKSCLGRLVDDGALPDGPEEEVEMSSDAVELMAATLAEAERIRDERGDSGAYSTEQMVSDIAKALQKTSIQYINKRISSSNKRG